MRNSSVMGYENGFHKQSKWVVNRSCQFEKFNKLLHSDSIQLSRFLLKEKNSTNLLAGEQGVEAVEFLQTEHFMLFCPTTLIV
jgi:hypothetical protein